MLDTRFLFSADSSAKICVHSISEFSGRAHDRDEAESLLMPVIQFKLVFKGEF